MSSREEQLAQRIAAGRNRLKAAGTREVRTRAARAPRTGPSRPLEGSLQLPGFTASVEIMTGADGVPHVWARSAADLFRAQGLLHYAERRWQIEVGSRVARGSLAELLGADVVPSDTLARVLGMPEVIAKAQSAMSEEVLKTASWYAQGAYAASLVVPSTAEHESLGIAPRVPTTDSVTSDSVAIFTGLGLALQKDWMMDLLRWAQEEPSSEQPVSAADLFQAVVQRFGAALPTGQFGSNAWAVPAGWSTTGGAVLAGDPHLDTRAPGHWMAMHLTCPEFNVIGATLPGIPGVVFGHNGRVAWMTTHARAMSSSLTLERLGKDGTVHRAQGTEPVRTRTEKAGQGADQDVSVAETSRGALLGLGLAGSDGSVYDLAVDCSWWRDPYPATALSAANLAGSLTELGQALSAWCGIPQTVVVGDVHGTAATVEVGSTMAADSPVLRRGWYDEPVAIRARHRIRRSTEPVVAANGRPPSEGFGHWEASLREDRIRELLAKPEIAPEASVRTQLDTYSSTAGSLLPVLGEAVLPVLDSAHRELLGALTEWDGRMMRDLSEPTLWAEWMRELVLLAWSDTPAVVANTILESRAWLTEWGYERLIASVHRRAGTAAGRAELAEALVRAARSLRARLGDEPRDWLWGRRHVVAYTHGLENHPSWAQAGTRIPQPGFDDTVCVGDSRARPRSGPTFRMVVRMDRPDESVWAFPVGNSGVAGAQHSDDRVEAWSRGTYSRAPFTRDAVLKLRGPVLKVSPGSSEGSVSSHRDV